MEIRGILVSSFEPIDPGSLLPIVLLDEDERLKFFAYFPCLPAIIARAYLGVKFVKSSRELSDSLRPMAKGNPSPLSKR